jgi:hypothetical protein
MIFTLRAIFGMLGIQAAITIIFYSDQLLRVLLGMHPKSPFRRIFGARLDLWQFPSIWGSFTAVLDHGLAGFWGIWWHQTFRVAFTGPTVWLRRAGWVSAHTRTGQVAIGVFLAFAQSSALHAAGGFTSLPRRSSTWWWAPATFFLLSGVGMLVQRQIVLALGTRATQAPLWARRAANLVFTAVWLLLTQWALIDDLCHSAIWLYEPVPISPLRAMGFGQPGDGWLRWADADLFPRWHMGKHWWQIGFAL